MYVMTMSDNQVGGKSLNALWSFPSKDVDDLRYKTNCVYTSVHWYGQIHRRFSSSSSFSFVHHHRRRRFSCQIVLNVINNRNETK